jgi:hypothetical protein
MNKDDYIKHLKETDLRPKPVKKIVSQPEILTDTNVVKNEQILSELFVQSAEIETLPTGIKRDMQILRLGIIAELDASNLYEKLAELADNADLKKTLLEISQEEKVHVGEFQALLDEIDPEFSDSIDEGEKEVEDVTEGVMDLAVPEAGFIKIARDCRAKNPNDKEGYRNCLKSKRFKFKR